MTGRCWECGEPSTGILSLCVGCEQAANASTLDHQVGALGGVDQVGALDPVGSSSVEAGLTTRSTALLGPRLLLGPDDLQGDRLRDLDDRPDVQAALERLGVRDARDHAARVSGRDRPRNGPEFAVWKLDMLRAAGLIEPIPVPLPALPDEASKAAHLLRDRFAVLHGLRALRDDGDEATPYTKRFAADWCGLSETTALRGIGELIRHAVIVAVDEHPSRGDRSPATLYLPGQTSPNERNAR